MKTLINIGCLYLDNLKPTEPHSFSRLEKDRQESSNTVD